MIKVIFIDWHKTLCYDKFWKESDFAHKVSALEKKLFIDRRCLLNPWMRGNLSTDEISESLSDDVISKDFIQKELIESSKRMNIFDCSLYDLITKIRNKGIKVVIATDNMDIFDFTIESLKLHKVFDGILNSSKMGILKEDVLKEEMLFFKDYLKNMNIKAEETVLLDDSEYTINLCKRYGMSGVVIKDKDDVIKELNKYV